MTADDGSVTTLVGQQRWFGLTGVHLVREQRDKAGRVLSARVLSHCESWPVAKERANDLHREAFGCDSESYFKETIGPLMGAMSQANELVAYEGLPHQHWERELLEKELASGQHLTLADFPFYARPVPIRIDDLKRLRTLCTTEGTFQRWRAQKSCGGFHPDWCLRWSGPAGDCRVVFCFGCSEARLYDGTDDEIWSDLGPAAFEECKAVLTRYRTNRPVR